MMTNRHVLTFPLFPMSDRPKMDPTETPRAAGNRLHGEEGRKIRVIVIDDEALIAETVAEILKQEGFDAVAVSNGLSAIELAEKWSPDVVLSDVIMPGLNGIETGIGIREVAPECKVILFSGQAATVDLLEVAREHGERFDILAKPVRPEQLIAVIRSSFRS